MGKEFKVDAWEENSDAVKIVASGRAAIAGILRMGAEVLEEHRKALISRMLWKITEANGKYTTRYQSVSALTNKNDLRHDHVWTRKGIVKRIFEDPGVLEHEVQLAIGCTVTKAEHDKLTRFDTLCDGWERYNRAGIAVWDLKEKKRIPDAGK